LGMTGKLKVVGPDEGRAIHWIGGKLTFMSTAASTAGAFTVRVYELGAEGGAAAHVHAVEEEFFYVLAGQLTFDCGGHSFVADTGAFVNLPKGLGHRFRNSGGGPARTWICTVPSGGEGFFLELGNPYSEPDDATVPPNPERFAAAAASYGQKLATPTLLHPNPKAETMDTPLGVGRAPTLREPGEGEAFTAEGVLVTLKAVGQQTLGAFALSEIAVAAGAASPAHRYGRYTESLYILDGELTLSGGASPAVASAGSLVVITIPSRPGPRRS